MPTTVLNLQSIAYPTISNRIRIDVYTQLDPLSVVATETDAIAGHPARIWSFPGLPRTNYKVTMNEIDGSGNPVSNLAFFDVVPNLLDGGLARDDEQIFPDITPGFYSGATHIRFDGATITHSDLAVHATGNIAGSSASTLALAGTGQPAANWWFFTLSGSVVIGDSVEVDWHDDHTGTDTSYTVTSIVLSGWTLSDLLADLLAKIQVLNPSAIAWVDSGNNGVFITGILISTGTVTVINAVTTPPAWWFTLQSTFVNPGDVVEVHYELDSVAYTVANVVKFGWTITDILADLLTKIHIIAPGAVLYSTGGFNGIKIPATTTATGSVLITNTPDAIKPDYRGWNINPERINKPGTLIRGQEYTWDTNTGDFDLLIDRDVFVYQEPYNIDFDVIEQDTGGSVGVTPEFTSRIVTTNDNILLSDFGNSIIAEPASDFITLRLPDISTVTANLPLSIEVDRTSNNCCVQVLQFGTDTVKFLWGKIYACRKETFRIYKFIRSAGVFEWRIINAYGNFSTVGKMIDFDQIESNMFDYVLCDGRTLDVNKYARLYDFVLRLPIGQVISFASWSTSKTRFSLSSGGVFHIPDRRRFYSRGGDGTEAVGGFYLAQVQKHKHISPYSEHQGVDGIYAPFGAANFTIKNKPGSNKSDLDNDWWYTNDGTEYAGAAPLNDVGVVGVETRPNSYSINKYVII